MNKEREERGSEKERERGGGLLGKTELVFKGHFSLNNKCPSTLCTCANEEHKGSFERVAFIII